MNEPMIKVDEEDRWLLEAYQWSIQKTSPNYAYRHDYVSGKRVRIYLHREILNADNESFVDHIDGNGLNCVRSNLRLCTHAENMRNRKVSKSNKLGVKGIWQRKDKFVAQIKSHGKRFNLGTFSSIDEAASAYRDAAKMLHGDFCRE